MPNWAFGKAKVTGTERGIISFVERFIDYQESVTEGKRYFARSFLDEDRSALIQRIRALHDGHREDEEMSIEFEVSFAWSAYSCVVEGYPQGAPAEVITLSEACMEDEVSVLIQTEEPGMCFEEELCCDYGEVSYESRDMASARCRACGGTQAVPSFADPDQIECYECGEIGFDLY